jgi:hypothetical protein
MKLIPVTDQKAAETHLIQLDLVRTITMSKNTLQFQFGLDDSWNFSKSQLGETPFEQLTKVLLALAAETKDGRFQFA